MTRGHRDHPLAVVGHHVQAEHEARAPRDLADRLVEGVAVDLRETHSGVFEEAHAVRRRDDRLAAAADCDGLSTAGPPGVLMRLDAARRHDEVGILHEHLRVAPDTLLWDRTKNGPLIPFTAR